MAEAVKRPGAALYTITLANSVSESVAEGRIARERRMNEKSSSEGRVRCYGRFNACALRRDR